MADRKKYDSTVCFQGKRLADIQFRVESIFNDSFLWIKVDHHKKEFIISLDNKAHPDKIQQFEADFKQCKIKIFQEISLAVLRAPSLKAAGR